MVPYKLFVQGYSPMNKSDTVTKSKLNARKTDATGKNAAGPFADKIPLDISLILESVDSGVVKKI